MIALAFNIYIFKFELLEFKYYSFLSYAIFLKSLKTENRILESPPERLQIVEEASIHDSLSSIEQFSEDPNQIDPKNLLAGDVNEVGTLIEMLSQIYGSIFQFIFFGILIAHLLGIHFLPGLCLILIISIITFAFTKLQAKYFSRLTKIEDKKIGITEEMIYSIDVIKSSHWESFFEEKLMRLRQKEMDLKKRMLSIEAFETTLWRMIPELIIFTALYSIYFSGGDYKKILGIIEVLIEPFGLLVKAIDFIIHGVISFRRIESYLKRNTYDENNKLALLNKNKPFNANENHIEISNLAFEYNLFSESHSNFSIRINNLSIKKGEKICILGRVGSGKTTLLNILAGQMDGYKMNPYGDYLFSINGSISMVAQNSWLINASVKVSYFYNFQENILFYSEFNKVKYKSVIDASELWDDIEQFSGGEQFIIGAQGCRLSGGQKKRIALARALYSQNDIFLIDEPTASRKIIHN